jgi:hypothetical protein
VVAVQSALGLGGSGREIFVLATCPLQFAKAGNAAALSQHEKSNSADVQRNEHYYQLYLYSGKETLAAMNLR